MTTFNSITGQGVRSISMEVGSAGGTEPDDWPDDPPVGPDGPLGPNTPQIVDVIDKAPPQAPPPWMVPGPSGGTVPGGGGPYGPQPERPPVPVATPPVKPKPKTFPPIVSGLGKDVDRLLNLSPKMRELWAKAKDMKVKIVLRNGPNEVKGKAMYINPTSFKDGHTLTPTELASLAAYEIDHATRPQPAIIEHPDREEFADRNARQEIAQEGLAAFTNAQIRDEILSAGGEDIGIRGDFDEAYIDIYNRLKSGEIPTEREAIAQMGSFASLELREMKDGSWATTKAVFLEKYRDEFDKTHQRQ
jgi:hypothetical protein